MNEPTELDPIYVDLYTARAEAIRCREALLGLFCVVKALACPGGLSTETLRQYLRTHPAAKEAASVLGTTIED